MQNMSLVCYGLVWCLVALGVMSKPMPQDTTSTTSADVPIESTICGSIVDYVNSDPNDNYILWASDAYTCMTAVPFNQAPALRFIEYYNTTLQFHASLEYLKNPPAGYQQPAIDVMSVLGRIKANVTAGVYQNQYEFESDMQKLVYACHDEHLDLRAGILAAFSFGSPYAITSVSRDGKEPPKVYITNDIIDAQHNGWTTEPVPIATIQGEDVVEYLTKFAANNSVGRLEQHAEWNDMMSHPAQDILGAANTFTGAATFYPDDQLNFTFANSSSATREDIRTYWLAVFNWLYGTGPLTTGGDFYNFFVLGLWPAQNGTPAESDDSSTVTRKSKRQDDQDVNVCNDTSWSSVSSAYPDKADVAQADLCLDGGGVVTGYFFDDISTGVLSIPTFDVYSDSIANFTSTVQAFIDGAQRKNIEHVVIDLQQNSGGIAGLAFDTFGRFFPGTEPYAGSRRRSHALANIIGNVTTTWWDGLDPNDETKAENIGNEWIITPRLNAETGDNFQSWDEYAGPETTAVGDQFSLVERYNLTNLLFNEDAMTLTPYGYANNPSNTTQAWDPKNIVILTDGICSSTCSLLVDFMTRQGVRTITMGGRPSTGPMQAVSGSRGAQAYSSYYLDWDMQLAGQLDPEANRTLPEIPPNGQLRDSGIWTMYAGFTLRDQIRQGGDNDTDAGIPLQFRYEAADCRLYYTLHNIYNMTQQWHDVASAAWTDSTMCVDGSTGYSTTGQSASAKSPPVPNPADQYLPFGNTTYQGDVDEEDSEGGIVSGIDIDTIYDGEFLDLSDTLTLCRGAADGTLCDSNAECLPIQVQCAHKIIEQQACLPICVSAGQQDGTQACNTFAPKGVTLYCDKTSQLESKRMVTAPSRKLTGNLDAPQVTFNWSVKSGICQPKFPIPAAKLGGLPVNACAV